MSSFVSTLNLRPQEKRVIVGLGVIVFVVLNILLVFPHFHDWSRIKLELADTEGKIETYNKKIYQDTNSSPDGLKNILRRMSEGKDGTIPQYKDIALQQTVTTEAGKCGVQIQSYQPAPPSRMGPTSQSDKYFESQAVRISVQSTEEALVKFLYLVGNDPAMIRVHELSLQAKDANRFFLSANITLIADYQKNADTNAPIKKTPPAPKPKPGGPPAPGMPTPPAPTVNRRPDLLPTNSPARRAGAPIMPPQMPTIPRPNRPSTNG